MTKKTTRTFEITFTVEIEADMLPENRYAAENKAEDMVAEAWDSRTVGLHNIPDSVNFSAREEV